MEKQIVIRIPPEIIPYLGFFILLGLEKLFN